MSKTVYTSDGYTFTVEQLLAGNPFVEPNGTVKKDCSFEFFAFNGARQQYELDQLSPEDRAIRQTEIDRFRDKMGS